MRLAITALSAACLTGALALPPAGAETVAPIIVAATASAAADAKPQKKSKKKSTRVKVIPSSNSETRSERERRLKRECQGRPNAGACLGYTR